MRLLFRLILLNLVVLLNSFNVAFAQTETAENLGNAVSADWNRDGTRLTLAYNYGYIEIVDATGQRQALLQPHGYLNAVRWNPADDHQLVCSSDDGRIIVFDVTTGVQLLNFRGNETVSGVAWSPDGKYIAVAGETGTGLAGDNTVVLWDASTGKLLMGFGTTEGIGTLAWNPQNSRQLAVGTAYGDLYLWDIARKKALISFRDEGTQFQDLDWSKDGNSLVFTVDNREIQVRSAVTGKELTAYRTKNYIGVAAWGPDERVAFSEADSINVLDVATGQVTTVLQEMGYVNDLAWSARGQLAVLSSDPTDATRGATLHMLSMNASSSDPTTEQTAVPVSE